MKDCETFVRGTIRFKGFSYIISSFHDLGLTSDLPVPSTVVTLRDLIETLISGADAQKVHPCADSVINSLILGIAPSDADLIKRFLAKTDISYLKGDQIADAYKSIIKSIRFFGFLDSQEKLVVVNPKNGNPFSYIEVFGEQMSKKLSMTDEDRDLVIMRHIFTMEDKHGVRWNEFS